MRLFLSFGSCILNPLASKIWGGTVEIAFREKRYFGPCVNQSLVFYVDLRFDLNANSASLCRGWYWRVYAFCVQGIISEMALRWRRGDVTVPNCWIKSLFLFYFRTKSPSLHNSQIVNHWWQMEYSGDVFHTFLDLDSVIYLAVNGTVTSLPVFIQNILNCVPKTN